MIVIDACAPGLSLYPSPTDVFFFSERQTGPQGMVTAVAVQEAEALDQDSKETVTAMMAFVVTTRRPEGAEAEHSEIVTGKVGQLTRRTRRNIPNSPHYHREKSGQRRRGSHDCREQAKV